MSLWDVTCESICETPSWNFRPNKIVNIKDEDNHRCDVFFSVSRDINMQIGWTSILIYFYKISFTFYSKVTRQWPDHLDWYPFLTPNYRSFNQPPFPCINTSISAIQLATLLQLAFFGASYITLFRIVYTCLHQKFFPFARHRIWFYKYTAFNNIDWAVIHGQQNWEIPGS
jgi:hypothetical protein